MTPGILRAFTLVSCLFQGFVFCVLGKRLRRFALNAIRRSVDVAFFTKDLSVTERIAAIAAKVVDL